MIYMGECVSQTPILVTYNGIHAEMQNIERGPGGGAPRKIFTSHALQIAGIYFFRFVTDEAEKVINSRLFRKQTVTQKYNVRLKVISSYFKSKMPYKSIKTAQRLGLPSQKL